MTIENCRFSMKRLNEEAHEFRATFLDKNGNINSETSHIFTLDPGKIVDSIGGRKTIDILSQNGISLENPADILSDKPGHLFEHKDVKELALSGKKFLNSSLNGNDVLIVLDLQDPNRSYLDKVAIQQNEASVVQLFSTKKEKLSTDFPDAGKSAKKVHSIFTEQLPLTKILCEGSVKASLVDTLSDSQAEFFLTPAKHNRSLFCQFTEPFLIGAKTGSVDQTTKRELSDFITPITPKTEDTELPARLSSTVVQETWYQGPYRDMYGPDAAIPSQLRNVYTIDFEVDDVHRITSMRLESPTFQNLKK